LTLIERKLLAEAMTRMRLVHCTVAVKRCSWIDSSAHEAMSFAGPRFAHLIDAFESGHNDIVDQRFPFAWR
jgi:hypothetical protein